MKKSAQLKIIIATFIISVLLQKKDMKLKLFKILALLLVIYVSLGASSIKFPVDARRNAVHHNNMGLMYMREGNIRAAIECYKIGIGLNPNKETSSTMYNNLGNAYAMIGNYDLAEECFLASIRFAPMHFEYYQNLALMYKKQNKLEEKLLEPKKVGNGMNDVLDGLIYIELGETTVGESFLNDFITKEPNLIITPAIKKYLKDIRL